MTAIIFPVLGLFLTTTVVAALGESHNGICRRQYLVTATSTDTGTQLYLSTSEPSNFTHEIPDHFLPTQCGENYKLCDVLLIEMESEVIVFVPSQGGFVMVTYQVGEPPHDIFHPVDRNCHPVKAFLNSEHNRIVIVCVELSSDTNGSLFIAEFSLSRMTTRYSEIFFLRSSSALSEAVYASNLFYHIFFTDIDDLQVTDADASSSLNPGFLTSINNCTQTKQIDVTENDVSIYCTPNNDSWTVPANSGIPTHHTYSRYPCPGLKQYARVENRRQVMFGNTTQQSYVGELPDDIAYAACLGSEDSFVFWAFTENGRLFSVPLTTENNIMTNLSACTTEGINCLRPSFDARKTCGAYFNHETNQVHITNITSLCGHRTVNMSVPPQLLRLTLGEKEDNCSCGANESPTSLPASDVIVAIVVSVVGVGLLVVVIIIICVVVKRGKCSCKCSYNSVRRKTSHSQVDFVPISSLVAGSECSDNGSDNKSISSVVKPFHTQGASVTFEGSDVEASNSLGNSVCENSHTDDSTLQRDYVSELEEVQVKPTQVKEDNGAGAGSVDVVIGRSNSHPRENFHSRSVAENNNAKSEGEVNQNRNLEIARHCRS